jgi:hypothetical protein
MRFIFWNISPNPDTEIPVTFPMLHMFAYMYIAFNIYTYYVYTVRKGSISIRLIIVAVKFRVTILKKCRVFTRRMHISYALCHEQASSSLFQSFMSILWTLIFWSAYVKCTTLHKEDNLLLNICGHYSWEIALKFRTGKGIRKKLG